VFRRVAQTYHVLFLWVHPARAPSRVVVVDDAVHLHAPRELLVFPLLSPSLLHLLCVSADLQSLAAPVGINRPDRLPVCRPGHTAVEDSPVGCAHRLGDSHPIQSVCVRHVAVVEPRAVAGFPLVAADHAELGGAAAFHVVAAFAEFDHGVALVAAFPALFLGLLDKASDFGIFRAVGRFVEFAGAEGTGFGFAFWAGGTLAAFFGVEVRGSDPYSAAGFRAVDSVAGVVFVVLFVEVDFEFEIKKVFDV
jgi:hypothetical protein